MKIINSKATAYPDMKVYPKHIGRHAVVEFRAGLEFINTVGVITGLEGIEFIRIEFPSASGFVDLLVRQTEVLTVITRGAVAEQFLKAQQLFRKLVSAVRRNDDDEIYDFVNLISDHYEKGSVIL